MKSNKSLTILFVWIFIFCFNSVALAANGNPGRPLFLPSPVTLDQEFLENMKAKNPTIMRSRAVRIDLDLLSVQENAEGRGPAMTHSMSMNLFDDVSLDVSMDRVEKNPSGSYSWIGKVRDMDEIMEESSVTIVNYDGIVMGGISSPDGFFNIRTLPNGQYIVNEVDPSKFPEEAPPQYAPADNADNIEEPFQGETLTQSEIAAAGGPVVDVLVAYTPAVRYAVGSTSLVQALIDEAMLDANNSYANSDVLHRLNLVHTHEVSYNGDTSLFSNYELHLLFLTNETDDYMNEVHSLRDQYGADLVVLLVDDNELCGKAFTMSSVSSSFENSAFSVVSYDCAAKPGYSLAHETGHNMGATHDRWAYDPEYPDDPYRDSRAYIYSHGYVNTSDRWRTIMAYKDKCDFFGISCPKIPNWSNPDVPENGLPTGIPEGEPDAADNAKTLNNTAPTVAGFRPSNHKLSITGGPAGSPNAVESGGQVNLKVTASDSSGHSLKYKWGATCRWSSNYGRFNDPTLQTPVWTAPVNTSTTKQYCTISVTVIDGTGLSDYGSYSQGVNFESDTSDTTPPNPPTGLTAILIKYKGTKMVELSWNVATDPSPGSGIYYYRIYRDGIFHGATTTDPNHLSVRDSGYTVGGNTKYQVYSVDNERNVSTSAASVIFKDGKDGGDFCDTHPFNKKCR